MISSVSRNRRNLAQAGPYYPGPLSGPPLHLATWLVHVPTAVYVQVRHGTSQSDLVICLMVVQNVFIPTNVRHLVVHNRATCSLDLSKVCLTHLPPTMGNHGGLRLNTDVQAV